MKPGDPQQDFASPGEALTALEESSENLTDHRTKPGTPGEILEHYGKKGMRWGVRNEDETAGRDSTAKADGKLKRAPDIPNTKDRIKVLTRTDRSQVLTPPKGTDGRAGQVGVVQEHHGLTRNQKIALGVGAAGLAAAGYVAYRHYTGNQMPGLDLEKARQEVQQLDNMKLPASWDVRGLNSGPISKQSLGHLAGSEVNAKLYDIDKLVINTSRGYADILPKDGLKNPAAIARHESVTKVLEEMREKYPSIRNMNVEVIPFSKVPGVSDSRAEMCVMSMRAGEARVMYNDFTDLPSPALIRANKKFLPGLGVTDYVAQHEMGHLLASAHGELPSSFHLLSDDASPAAWKQWQKAEPLLHKKMFAKHGFTFKELSKLSQYAATQPAEAMAELFGHYSNPEMRARLTPEQIARAEAMFNEMGGL